MVHTVSINQKSNSIAIVIAIMQLVCILAVRLTAKVRNLLKLVHTWLVSKHTFVDDEDPTEKVVMTGYQYIKFAVIVTIVAFILSIKF